MRSKILKAIRENDFYSLISGSIQDIDKDDLRDLLLEMYLIIKGLHEDEMEEINTLLINNLMDYKEWEE